MIQEEKQILEFAKTIPKVNGKQTIYATNENLMLT